MDAIVYWIMINYWPKGRKGLESPQKYTDKVMWAFSFYSLLYEETILGTCFFFSFLVCILVSLKSIFTLEHREKSTSPRVWSMNIKGRHYWQFGSFWKHFPTSINISEKLKSLGTTNWSGKQMFGFFWAS